MAQLRNAKEGQAPIPASLLRIRPLGVTATVRTRRLPREEVPDARAAVPRRTGTGARHRASGVQPQRGLRSQEEGASAPPLPGPAPTRASPRTRVTSGTPRVAKQPIPTSGRILAFLAVPYCASAVEISAHLIGGARMLVSADWIRGNPPRRRGRGAQSQWSACFPPVARLALQSWWT